MTWDPFRLTDPLLPVLRLAEELGRPLARDSAAAGGPAVDLFSHESGLLLCVSLPGLRAEDVELGLEGDRLVLAGAFPEPPEGRVLRRERPTGRFRRVVHLPHRVEVDEVEARFERGLLLVTLPRARAERPVHIPVRSAATAQAQGGKSHD